MGGFTLAWDEKPWLEPGNPFDVNTAVYQRNGSPCRSGDQLRMQFIADAATLVETLGERLEGERLEQFRRHVYMALRSRSLYAKEYGWELTDWPRAPWPYCREGSNPQTFTAAGFKECISTLSKWWNELNDELSKDPFSSWFERDDQGDMVNTVVTDPDELHEDMQHVLQDLGFVIEHEDGYWIRLPHPEDCEGCEDGEDMLDHEYSVRELVWTQMELSDLTYDSLGLRVKVREGCTGPARRR
ncbi:hypothetical protein GS882_07630 [Rhodococcus hoagii]|uniref:Uncharacterized protein n=1 Tax=Rhodococcus hoagii TaxID=43767 RepID=A0A9Q4ZK16_RHOHA|nr:hypothetical protein [Prescottella equi]